MITGNGVLRRLKHNSRLGRAKYGLHVHLEPTRTFVARIIGDRSTLNPPICPAISPPARCPRPGATNRSRLGVFPGRPTLIYGVQRFWLAIRARIWSSPGFSRLPSPRSFRSFGSHVPELEYSLWDRIRRRNEAAVFDTSRWALGSCGGDGCLTNTSPGRPLRTCSVRRLSGSALGGSRRSPDPPPLPGTSPNEIS